MIFRTLNSRPSSLTGVWEGVTSLWDDNWSPSGWFQRNVYSSERTPTPTLQRPSGPVVPVDALNPNRNYMPYSDQYSWCEITDVDCLNRAEAAKAANQIDARTNVVKAATEFVESSRPGDGMVLDTQNPATDYTWYVIGGIGLVALLAMKGSR